jgi:hypothetical protein
MTHDYNSNFYKRIDKINLGEPLRSLRELALGYALRGCFAEGKAFHFV